MTSYWRKIAAPIIAGVLAETNGMPAKEIRAALRQAYPFGVRRHHPYRIWLDEVRVQTGRCKLGSRASRMQGRPPGVAQPPLLPEGEA